MQSKVSKIKSIKKLESNQDRYNLEIEDNNNYFANNILVHNCRCLAYKKNGKVKLMSRQNKEYTAPVEVIKQLEKNLPEGLVLDGELYIHGTTFQTLVSWIKKRQPDSSKIEYHVYDVLDENKPFYERFQRYTNWWSLYSPKNIVTVNTRDVENEEDIAEYHSRFTSEGYEGAILRVGDCTYRPGYRSHELLKVKEFITEEFEIVGAEENKGKMEGQCSFILRTQQGTEFTCKPEGNEELRSWYWTHHKELIGKMMTVRFFEWTTSENPVPRFPIGVSVDRWSYE